MNLIINGKCEFISMAKPTIEKLMDLYDFRNKSVVVEYNGEVIFEFNKELYENDKIEFIKIVGGG